MPRKLPYWKRVLLAPSAKGNEQIERERVYQEKLKEKLARSEARVDKLRKKDRNDEHDEFELLYINHPKKKPIGIDYYGKKKHPIGIGGIKSKTIVIISTKDQSVLNKKLEQKEMKTEYYPITESTCQYVGTYMYDLKEKLIEENKEKHKGGFSLDMKIKLADPEDEMKWHTVIIKKDDTKSVIVAKFVTIANKHFDTSNYIMHLRYIITMVAGYGDKGGCTPEYTCKSVTGKTRYDKIKVKSYKSKNNNCLLQCFNKEYKVLGNVFKLETVRKDLKYVANTKIGFDKIPEISAYYNRKFEQKKGYMVINQEGKILIENVLENKLTDYIKIYLEDEHYSLYDAVHYDSCKGCGRSVNTNNTSHKCDPKSVSYKNRVLDKKFDVVNVKNIKEKEKLDYSRLVHFDLETFQPNHVHEPYACGWNDGTYKVAYGENCIDKMVDEFINYENKIINAYNGSGFDFYFLIDKFTERNIDIEDVIISNGRVISFRFGNNNKVMDLYLFIMSSLETACDDFKIANKKSTLDHSLFKTWADTEKYKKIVLPYLKLDVEGLKELFESFNSMIYDLYKVNIDKFVTLSHMAYELWSSNLKHTIEIPKEMKKYNYINLGKYGSRCYPQQMEFKSKHYDDVINGKMNYDELIATGDYISNQDGSSLFPTAMAGFKLCPVSYPVGMSRWGVDGTKEFSENKIGFYTIKYSPAKNIRVPILPRRKMMNGISTGISWSLEDGEGVYTSVDIQSAIECGYKVEFVGECLVWDEQASDVFTDYISTFYELKKVAEGEKNEVKRSIAKLLLNALYGKTLQRAIFTTTAFINNVFDFHDFSHKYDVTDWKILNDNKIMLTGESKNKETRITKPCQLGAFVLAYSRKIMLTYMKAVDPTLKSMPFTYSDTDSLHIFGPAHKKLKELGYIMSKKDVTLGYLTSDIKEEGVIIHEINLAPKTYMYAYINQKEEMKYDDTATIRCKGIPIRNPTNKKEKLLNHQMYKDNTPKPVSFGGLKKKHLNLTKADQEKDINHFSVVNSNQTRTFMKNSWKGMNLVNGEWYPLGYIKD